MTTPPRPEAQAVHRLPCATLRVSAWRMGLATNSSSTHSMIRSPRAVGLEIPQSLISDLARRPYDFGQDEVIIAHTPLRKRRYLASMLMDAAFELYSGPEDERSRGALRAADIPIKIARACGLPEGEAPLIAHSDQSDMQGGALMGQDPRGLSDIPRQPGGEGPEAEWLRWALEQCDDPEVIFCDYSLVRQLGLGADD